MSTLTAAKTPQEAGLQPAARKIRLAYFLSHPIQYQAPLLAVIAQHPEIDLTVFYSSDFSLRAYADKGFGGVAVKWDRPLLDGYHSEFLPRIRDIQGIEPFRPLNYGIYSRLKRGNFDVVWSHGYATVNTLHFMLAAKRLQLPVILRAESTLQDRPRSAAKLKAKRAFFSGLSHLVDAVMPIGTWNAQYWTEYFGDRIPQFPFPYAVDNAFFQEKSAEAAPLRESFRQELNLEPGRPVILYASKLQTRKRCVDLVEAYLRLAPSPGKDPHPYLLIAGNGEETPALEAFVKQSGCTSIRFLGFQNQTALPRLFDLCDVFVLPSIHEPWGLIVNEVMNAGRAIIVSDDVGCHPDLVADGVNGCVFKVLDVDDLTRALHRVIDDPAVTREMGRKSLERINKQSYQQDVQGLLAAIRHVTAPKRK